VYRLETKQVLRRVKKIGKAHVFEAAISETATQCRLLNELIAIFGGRVLLLPEPEATRLTASR
jgi:hypothetical protein